MKYNINKQITIYPNDKGWTYIKAQLLSMDGYCFKNYEDFEEYFQKRITTDNGYKEQFHEIASLFPMLFNIGTDYLKTTDIKLEL